MRETLGWKSLALWLAREIAYIHYANMARKTVPLKDKKKSKYACEVALASIKDGHFPFSYEPELTAKILERALDKKEPTAP